MASNKKELCYFKIRLTKIKDEWQNNGVEMIQTKTHDEIPSNILEIEDNEVRQKVFESQFGKVKEEYPHRIYNVWKQVDQKNPYLPPKHQIRSMAEILWPDCDYSKKFLLRLHTFTYKVKKNVKKYIVNKSMQSKSDYYIRQETQKICLEQEFLDNHKQNRDHEAFAGKCGGKQTFRFLYWIKEPDDRNTEGKISIRTETARQYLGRV